MRQLLLIGLVILLAACKHTPDLDYDQSANFANYKTFAWVENASLTKDNDDHQISSLMEMRVKAAVNQQLQSQGFTLVDNAAADMLVDYHASVDTRIEDDKLSVSYGLGWGYWGFGYQVRPTIDEYEVGTLVIDLIDSKTKQLIWRGAKESRLHAKQTPQQRTAKIRKTVSGLLQHFPPKS